MSFVKKIWKDRISQFPNRRTINDGYVTKQVTVGRDEGAVTEEGTPFDATEMNDLENRIYAAIEEGGGGGGSAGTYNYNELFNKPRINNHELNGNKSLSDLGIASNANELPIESGSATTTKDYIDTGLSGKADTGDIPTRSDFIRYEDKTIGVVEFTQPYWLVPNAQRPSVPSGYMYLFGYMKDYGSITSGTTAVVNVGENGTYLFGVTGTKYSNVKVRYVYIKS